MKNKISNIYKEILNKINEKNPYNFLIKFWNETIGIFSSKTKIKNFEEGVLYVFVSDSRILHELSLLSPYIIKALNDKIENENDKNFFKINKIKYIFNSNLDKNFYKKSKGKF